jgi:hypothetical protein
MFCIKAYQAAAMRTLEACVRRRDTAGTCGFSPGSHANSLAPQVLLFFPLHSFSASCLVGQSLCLAEPKGTAQRTTGVS